MDHLTLIGAIAGVLGVAVGPGGVFYFLVKRGLNGSVRAIERTDKTVSHISKIQVVDHDRLLGVMAALDQIQETNRHYYRIVDEHTKNIVQIQSRCDLLHKWQIDQNPGGV
jgi:hypothetical protein